MSSIEEIKQRKLDELKKLQLQEHRNKKSSNQKYDFEMLESLVKQKFTKDALQRYGNLKTAHPQKAAYLVQVIAQIINAGSLQAMITDEQLKKLLEKLAATNKDFTITRK